MKFIQVFGPGCPNCVRLASQIKEIADTKGVEYKLDKVTDLQMIAAMGVLSTPAVAVDGEMKVVGKVPSASEIESWLS